MVAMYYSLELDSAAGVTAATAATLYSLTTVVHSSLV